MSTIQVDRIIPYQSSSVLVEGLSAPNLATTGSNTFVGDQNIQGTITASIQEGFALVGGVGDVSTLVATSSFGEALPSGVVSGSAQISALGFAGTGSNTFVGNQEITGSVIISGSDFIDLRVVGNVQVTGSIAGIRSAVVPDGLFHFSGSAQSTLQNGILTNTNGAGGTSGVSPTIINNTDTTGGAGQQKTISFSANPSLVGAPSLVGITQPSLMAFRTGGPYQILELQSQGNYTDGTATFKVPVAVTGSVTISGSAGNDLVIEGRQLITGPETPLLNVSSSTHTNTIGARTYQIGKPGFNYPLFLAQYTTDSSSLLLNFTENLSATASYTVGVFDNGFTQDVELQLETTIGSGIRFLDIDSVSGLYTEFLRIAPNGGTNPPLEFKRSAEVTGSVNISQVLKLGAQDPLPGNGVGQLAVSGSNLYYNDGSTWTQIN